MDLRLGGAAPARRRLPEAFERLFRARAGPQDLAHARLHRRLVLGGGPVDRFRAGGFGALDDEARAGPGSEATAAAAGAATPARTSDESSGTGVGAKDAGPGTSRAADRAIGDRGRFKSSPCAASRGRRPICTTAAAALEDVSSSAARRTPREPDPLVPPPRCAADAQPGGVPSRSRRNERSRARRSRHGPFGSHRPDAARRREVELGLHRARAARQAGAELGLGAEARSASARARASCQADQEAGARPRPAGDARKPARLTACRWP
jgi:hypothetical protein